MLSESFQTTFKELFGGGTARLELEDERTFWAVASRSRPSPPGKALKTISLLSGGEKAFVAIALYFAILKVHPTPFCIMDEIEAALDDANVTRYARYMRTLAGHTQFIVITHRRGTMEEADVLYGVTMQEQGVSKILTINLNDMAKEAEDSIVSMVLLPAPVKHGARGRRPFKGPVPKDLAAWGPDPHPGFWNKGGGLRAWPSPDLRLWGKARLGKPLPRGRRMG